VCHETDAAGIVLVSRVIQSLRVRRVVGAHG
jgi:hypothetical protein